MKNRIHISLTFFCLAVAYSFGFANPHSPKWALLSLDELLMQDITSVSKKDEQLFDIASAVSVIRKEEISRSGVSRIPELLRYTPGVQIGKVNNQDYAISIRGNNDLFSNKLLVLMDGRSLYNPLFSGVYWNAQHYPLMDLEVIEIIRGPGSTVWGANAVNGVININSKSAKDTLGVYSSASAGNELNSDIIFRYGGEIQKNLYYRVYLEMMEEDDSYGYNVDELASQQYDDYGDNSSLIQSGFRVDYEPSEIDHYIFQGDIYQTNWNSVFRDTNLTNTAPFREIKYSDDSANGHNLLAKWHHEVSDENDFDIRFGVDNWIRRLYTFKADMSIYELGYTQNLSLYDIHELTFGGGYTQTQWDYNEQSDVGSSHNVQETKHQYNGFMQDDIELLDDELWFVLGAKFSHHYYSGIEVNPSAKLLLKPNEDHAVWGSVTRSVQTPNFGNRDVTFLSGGNDFSAELPIVYRKTFLPNNELESEEVYTFELGHRIKAIESMSLEYTLFYTLLDNGVTNYVIDAKPEATLSYRNNRKAQTYGLEIVSNVSLSEKWRLALSYTFMQEKDETAITDFFRLNESPRHQASIKSTMEFSDSVILDLGLRYVDGITLTNPLGVGPSPLSKQIDSYVQMDVSIGWNVLDRLNCSLSGNNLLNQSHGEYINTFFQQGLSEVERTVMLKLDYHY